VFAEQEVSKVDKKEDLPSFIVSDKDRNFSFKIFFEEELENIAKESWPILNKLYVDLALNAGLLPSEVNWAEIAFVTDENYMPPRKNGIVRWKVVHPVADKLSGAVIEKLYVFIGHEQTHSIQNKIICDSPRWLEEGQAMWNELKVTEKWSSAVARAEWLRYEQDFKNLNDDLNLDGWGGIIVKPEAIERQLTSEQKMKMKEHPNYSPPGPFSFGPDDMMSDESNSGARYFVSMQIIDYLEKQLGNEKLKLFFNDVYKLESCSSSDLKELLKEKYETDVSAFF
jgi:hypothetical protein